MKNNQESERAWKLWEMLSRMESFLWDSYYEYFMEMCMNKADDDHTPDEPDDFPF